MPRLTVIVGLPGSGKSTLFRSIRVHYPGVCTPDFHAGACGDLPAVTASRHYPGVVTALREGRDCLIADVAYTDTWKRLELGQIFTSDVPGVEMEYLFFENDLAQCQANIHLRQRPGFDRELELATFLSERYFPTVGATMLPVWRPE